MSNGMGTIRAEIRMEGLSLGMAQGIDRIMGEKTEEMQAIFEKVLSEFDFEAETKVIAFKAIRLKIQDAIDDAMESAEVSKIINAKTRAAILKTLEG